MSSRTIIKIAFNLGALSLSFLSLNVFASIDCSALEEWQTGQTHVAGDQVQACLLYRSFYFLIFMI
ncbi:hypothetical protein [Pseudoalteromonas sp.]|uniref:hypothetical protein n=1 Tax=Pseudoalteromonas sp. TaxID=53249 RepID=UPI001BCFBFEC|nr:hypothetical protein [Pseudoalteromonas sp.]